MADPTQPAAEPPVDLTSEYMRARREWIEKSKQGFNPGPYPQAPTAQCAPEPTPLDYNQAWRDHLAAKAEMERRKTYDPKLWGL